MSKLEMTAKGTDLIIRDLLLSGLLSPQGDGVADELTVLLDQILQPALLNVLQLVLLHTHVTVNRSQMGAGSASTERHECSSGCKALQTAAVKALTTKDPADQCSTNLQVQDDFGTTAERVLVVASNGE